MKIVINTRYGGFSVSREAILWLRQQDVKWALETPVIPGEKYRDGSVLTSSMAFNSHYPDIGRDDPDLVRAVEELDSKVASGQLACLKVVEIPDGVEWEIMEYDGSEWVAEKHRTWG